MNKKSLLLAPLAVIVITGCSSGGNADTGDSGIEKMPVTKTGDNPAAGNPNIPAGAKAGIATPGK